MLIADNSAEIENGRNFKRRVCVCTHVSLCVMWENGERGRRVNECWAN